eukprot:TRINITY_DN8036_c0_g1_i1.p1 TRINITY_DN8036_c0_g1~~TRINITY_DN8036_c0_g1_i1.p1  ORF type:complete len:453 (+),score=103.13 TRINITY_DN8036_c0_g1_i1:140-1360(+)
MADVTNELEPLDARVDKIVDDQRHTMSMADLLELCQNVSEGMESRLNLLESELHQYGYEPLPKETIDDSEAEAEPNAALEATFTQDEEHNSTHTLDVDEADIENNVSINQSVNRSVNCSHGCASPVAATPTTIPAKTPLKTPLVAPVTVAVEDSPRTPTLADMGLSAVTMSALNGPATTAKKPSALGQSVASVKKPLPAAPKTVLPTTALAAPLSAVKRQDEDGNESDDMDLSVYNISSVALKGMPSISTASADVSHLSALPTAPSSLMSSLTQPLTSTLDKPLSAVMDQDKLSVAPTAIATGGAPIENATPAMRPIQQDEYNRLPEFVKSLSLDFIQGSYSALHETTTAMVEDGVCGFDDCHFTKESLQEDMAFTAQKAQTLLLCLLKLHRLTPVAGVSKTYVLC